MTAYLKLAGTVALVLVLAQGAYTWRVLSDAAIVSGETILVTIERGDSFAQVARQLLEVEAIAKAPYYKIAAFFLNAESQIKAGEYELQGPMNSFEVFRKLISGQAILHRQTLFEGWTIRDILDSMRQNPTIQMTERPLEQFGFDSYEEAEGWCLPDTYKHYRGDQDIKILELCFGAMQRVLTDLWADRSPGLPYKTPRDALILASIVEVETNLDHERPQVAGVLVSRLKKKMRLQADPTVIYGLGEDFDNNLTRKHLRQGPDKNRYNTYQIGGLPPGPISNPGYKSIQAALHPDMQSEALYYVSRGDGSHHFSKTYEEHRKAVRKYQKNAGKSRKKSKTKSP